MTTLKTLFDLYLSVRSLIIIDTFTAMDRYTTGCCICLLGTRCPKCEKVVVLATWRGSKLAKSVRRHLTWSQNWFSKLEPSLTSLKFPAVLVLFCLRNRERRLVPADGILFCFSFSHNRFRRFYFHAICRQHINYYQHLLHAHF